MSSSSETQSSIEQNNEPSDMNQKHNIIAKNIQNPNRINEINIERNTTLKLKPPPIPLKRKQKTKDEIILTSSENILNKPTTGVKSKVEILNRDSLSYSCNSNSINIGVKRQKIDHNIKPKESVPIVPTEERLNIMNSDSQKVTGKPPIPPKPDKTIITQIMKVNQPKMKKKLEETNNLLVQKLNALAEKLRLENADLMKALNNEKGAVRTLRAQSNAENRRAKLESKQLHDAILAQNKLVTNRKDNANGNKSLEHNKLNQEIGALKDAIKILEEKLNISTEAERKKSSDILEMKDMYEIRLTQANKSAKSETQRLLEEIKTKERNIGQLKKEIKSLQSVHSVKGVKNAQTLQESYFNPNAILGIKIKHKTNKPNNKFINILSYSNLNIIV